MHGIKLFKKVLMPCGICAAVPIIKSAESKEEPVSVSNDHQNKKLVRPSELPIYTFEKAETRETPCKEQDIVEQGFGTVRKSVQDFLKQFTGYTDVVTNTIDTGYAHTQVTLDYLREESNVLPRIGAVGVGGLSGLILGLRGGKFKRFVYSYTGAVVVALICYPNRAQDGMTLAKYYINVGYNFLYGVKPGDENQLQISWPEFRKVPTSFSEVADLAGSAAGSAISAAGTLVGKASQAFHDFAESKPPFDESEKKK